MRIRLNELPIKNLKQTKKPLTQNRNHQVSSKTSSTNKNAWFHNKQLSTEI